MPPGIYPLSLRFLHLRYLFLFYLINAYGLIHPLHLSFVIRVNAHCNLLQVGKSIVIRVLIERVSYKTEKAHPFCEIVNIIIINVPFQRVFAFLILFEVGQTIVVVVVGCV